jgi:hypothetical protein
MPQEFRRVYGGRGGGGYSVTGKQRDDGKGPLNEREREILEELERQMGGEVGITPSDPEEARRRENDKARVDLWRIIAFLNIALLAGIGATVGFLVRPLPSSNYLLVVSVALNLSGLLLAFFALALAGAGRRGCLYGVRAVGVVVPDIRGEQPQRPASLAASSLLQTFVCSSVSPALVAPSLVAVA